MVHVPSLWMPILLAAALAFVASSVIHMVLGYHRKDFGGVTDEDGLMDALRGFGIPPGDYSFPHAGSKEVMGSEELREKWTRGPTGFMTLLPSRDLVRPGVGDDRPQRVRQPRLRTAHGWRLRLAVARLTGGSAQVDVT
ncbi:hypothetical protein [Candidatus Palauibacter sp.]|uniref:hypothetical protein n=1 Tax=Candidatus Palauibacter sp. TaxID=3101350 RepID=UPI003B01813B